MSIFKKGDNRRNVTIIHEQLTAAIRSTMAWPARKGTYRIPGIRIPNSPQIFLCFDLKLGSCVKRGARKVDPKTFLSACPSIRDIKQPNSKFVQLALPSASTAHADFKQREPDIVIFDAREDECVRH